jgi:lytic murein transglycosylase
LRSKPLRRSSLLVFTAALVATALLATSPALAQRGACHRGASFEQWLDAFKRDAVAQGVSPRAISSAAHLMVYDQSVVNKDRGQKVFSQTFLEFSDRMVARHRIDGGIQRIAKNRPLFTRIEQQFGVPAPVIAAFWALETDFGGFMGNLPTLKSVTSLAYDCRRPDLFRTQLLSALKIIDRGDLTADQMIGPFAGELGQFQFLPAHYLDYGVDYDGDGRRDLIRSTPDALASAANYMSKIGWKRGQPWLEEVTVPASMDWSQADLTIQHPRSQWARWGVTKPGGALPADAQPASLLLPMGRFGPAFLAYPNFQLFLEWNQSIVYSTSAAYLATRINGAPAMHRGSKQVVPFASAQIRELQTLLARRGHDVGKVDGFLGLKSRSAVKAEQIKLGLPADSYPTPELVARLR